MQLWKRLVEDVPVEEHQCVQGLVLGGRGDVALAGQVGEKGGDVPCVQLRGVALAEEEDVAPDSLDVRLFRPAAVLPDPDGLPHKVQELGWRHSACGGGAYGTTLEGT